MVKIKTKLTCVRYPGGKSNALKFLDTHLLKDFTEYREPFFGGGSVGLYLMQFNKDATYWINDLFYPVYCFWKVLYEQPDAMVKFLLEKKHDYRSRTPEVVVKGTPSKSAENGKLLHTWCRTHIQWHIDQKDEFTTACFWYILNKTSYSGMSMIGSYASLAWDQNFTDNCIKNLPKTAELMHSVKNIRVTNLDYSVLLQPDGDHDDNTFVFLDPPYKIPHNLYGDKGDMHEGFDHKKFTDAVKQCPAQWLITYNDDADLKEWFKNSYQLPWELQYTMKAAKRDGQEGSKKTGKSGKKGQELLIASYPLTVVGNCATLPERADSTLPTPTC